MEGNCIYDIAKIFDLDKVSTYFKGTYEATLDHICGNTLVIRKITSFEVVSNEADTSDHRAIRCCIESVSNDVVDDGCLQKSSVKHKFPWRNSLFCEE